MGHLSGSGKKRQSGLQLLSKDKHSSLLALGISDEEEHKRFVFKYKHSSLLALGVTMKKI